MAIERLRDERGRFIKASEAAKKLQHATEKATAAYPKMFAKMSTGLEHLTKLHKAQAKAIAGVEKHLLKMARAQKKLAASMSKSMKASGFGSGLKMAIPGILAPAAIIAATKAMSSYVTQLARARDIAAAMAGGRRLGLNQRDSSLFADYAAQDFANRFASKIEISGLQRIRDTLSKGLGPEVGKRLALDLTRGFQDSGERAKFLAMASTDVVAALKQFQSVDIDKFSTALAGATQETDSLSRTAFTLEKAWRDVQNSFETFVVDFVKRNEIDLTTSIQDIAQGVVDLINYGRQLAAEYAPVFSFFTDNLKATIKLIRSTGKEWQLLIDSASGFWSGGDTRNRIERQIDEANRIGAHANVLMAQAERAKAAGDETRAQKLADKAREMMKQQQKLYGISQDFFGVMEDVEPVTLGIAANVQKMKLNTDKAVESAKKQREEFEKTLTVAEKVALATQRIREQTSTENLHLDLIRAQLARYEASPLGFGGAFEARLRGAKQIDKLLELNRKRQEEVNKLNLSLRENRERLIKLQIEENQLIAEKNSLLKQTAKGYLDAIQAQAFGAGRFQKILVDQEQNTAMALLKGIARKNPALGLIGDEAARNKVDPFRWTGRADEDARELTRHHKQLEGMFREFIKEMKGVFVPPVPREILDIRAGAAAKRGRPMAKPPVKARAANGQHELVEQAKEMKKQSQHTSAMWQRFIELLGELPAHEDIESETMRPTRIGGRVSLGGN